MTERHNIGVWLGLALAAAPMVASAQEDQADPNEWVIETYQIPITDYISVFDPGPPIPDAPQFPAADANAEAIATFLRESSSFVSRYFEKQNLIFPEGALFAFDPNSTTLAARLPRSRHSDIEAEVFRLRNSAQTYIAYQAHIVEAPAGKIRAMIEAAAESPNHLQLLDKFEDEIVVSLSGEAKSGQRAKVEQAREFVIMGQKNAEGEPFTEQVGTILEVDPVLTSDGAININAQLIHHYAPPTERIEDMGEAYNGTSTIRTNTFSATVVTSLDFVDGGAKLLGTWKPVYGPNHESDTLQAAFLKTDIVSIRDALNPRIPQLLKEHGDLVLEPPPYVPNEEKENEPADGMVQRAFGLPPGGCGNKVARRSADEDPFADLNSNGGLTRRKTAREILEDNGIRFPDGSSAIFNATSSTLIVRNTPENMSFVEAYVDSLNIGPLATIGIAVHVVEAPGALIRETFKLTEQTSDHSEAWTKVRKAAENGDAKILSSSWLNCSSGQRTRVAAGEIHRYGGYPRINQITSVTTFPSLERLVGTAVEFDPVIMADGRHVDLSLNPEFHYARPSIPNIEGDNRYQEPQFHFARVTTSSTLRDGQIRMLGSWQPRGTPNFDDADVLQAMFVRVNLLKHESTSR